MEMPNVGGAGEPRLIYAIKPAKVAKTSAERSREWRARRANDKKVFELKQLKLLTSTTTVNGTSQLPRREITTGSNIPKKFNSSTERTRKWRARLKNQIETSESGSSTSTSNASPPTTVDNINALATSSSVLKRTRTAVEPSQECRVRQANGKKTLISKSSTSVSSLSPSIVDDTSTSSQFIIENIIDQLKEKRVLDDDEVSQLKVFVLPHDEYSIHDEASGEYEEPLILNEFDEGTDDCDPLGFDNDVTQPTSLNNEFTSADSQPCLIKTELDLSDDMITDSVTPNDEESISNRNFQSIKEHHPDLMHTVTQDRTLFLFSETLSRNENLPHFECCVQFKGDDQQSTAVGLYHKEAYDHAVTSHMEVISHQGIEMSMTIQPIGEICTAKIQLPDGNKILFLAVYILPETSVQDIIKLLYLALAPYSKRVSQHLQGDHHLVPIIISGYFNIDFLTPNARPLIDFMREKFDLIIDSEAKISTTQDGTIDAVFQRYLENLQSRVYISHFNYYNSIVSISPKIEQDE